MECIKYPSIGQYRNVVKKIKYHSDIPPILEVTCSEKIHGANMSVCMDKDGMWFQSRKNILTNDEELLKEDGYQPINMFYNFDEFLTDERYNALKDILLALVEQENIDLSKKTIALFFEYAGGSIQRNSACTGLPKRCFIFQHFMVKDSNEKPDENGKLHSVKWHETKLDDYWVSSHDENIFNIMNFKTYKFMVDFSKPLEWNNRFIEVVDEIEQESPVGKYFGKKNIGEGIVCTLKFKDNIYKFKVKGDKHANNKVKKLKAIDEVKLKELNEFVNSICHNWRFEQGMQEVFGSDYENTMDRKKLGEYLKWISLDTLKEEGDLIENSEFTKKEIMSRVTNNAKKYYMSLEKY